MAEVFLNSQILQQSRRATYAARKSTLKVSKAATVKFEHEVENEKCIAMQKGKSHRRKLLQTWTSKRFSGCY